MYMICPISAIEDFETLTEAKTQAELLTKKLGENAGGFVVYEVYEIGRYEHVSPIWNDAKGILRDKKEPL
jgi:hypothetical protein